MFIKANFTQKNFALLFWVSTHHYCYPLHSTQATTLPSTYAWPVSSMEEQSDSFLDLVKLQAELLWDTAPNDLRRKQVRIKPGN